MRLFIYGHLYAFMCFQVLFPRFFQEFSVIFTGSPFMILTVFRQFFISLLTIFDTGTILNVRAYIRLYFIKFMR